MNHFLNDPFEMLFRSSPYTYSNRPVYVIPDSEYQELRQEEVKRQVNALESKANRYFTAAQEIEERVAELRKEHNLLPAGEDTKELAGATK